MEFFRIKRDIPFMRYALVLATRGLNFGVDFRGGTVIEVAYNHPVDFNRLRGALDKLSLGEYSAQAFGSSVPLKEGVSNAQLSEQVMSTLRSDDPSVTLKRVEFVGPQVGKELYENGALALLLVIAGIVAYLAMRFEWRFAVAAIIANLHDVIIILGFFAFFQWEFGLPVLAAVLAILGYSVNESVVIADRIRENFRKMRKASVETVIDNAITSTMSRTMITHGSTLLMVLSIFFFGGETLHFFSLALAIGICFGIYSSVLVMAPLVRWLGVSREDLVKPEKKKGPEGEKILP